MLPIPDDQHRAGSLPNDVFGDAPRKHVFQPGAPMRGHDDQVRGQLFGCLDDFKGWLAVADRCLG